MEVESKRERDARRETHPHEDNDEDDGRDDGEDVQPPLFRELWCED